MSTPTANRVPALNALIPMVHVGSVPRSIAFHAAVKDAGVAVEEITYPPEPPHGRFRVSDPDGYDLAVTHT
jgi:hypothetical protein